MATESQLKNDLKMEDLICKGVSQDEKELMEELKKIEEDILNEKKQTKIEKKKFKNLTKKLEK